MNPAGFARPASPQASKHNRPQRRVQKRPSSSSMALRHVIPYLATGLRQTKPTPGGRMWATLESNGDMDSGSQQDRFPGDGVCLVNARTQGRQGAKKSGDLFFASLRPGVFASRSPSGALRTLMVVSHARRSGVGWDMSWSRKRTARRKSSWTRSWPVATATRHRFPFGRSTPSTWRMPAWLVTLWRVGVDRGFRGWHGWGEGSEVSPLREE